MSFLSFLFSYPYSFSLLNFLPYFSSEEVDVLFSSLLGLLLAVEWFLLGEWEKMRRVHLWQLNCHSLTFLLIY